MAAVTKLFAHVKEMVETQEMAKTARELRKQACDNLYQKVRKLAPVSFQAYLILAMGLLFSVCVM